MFFLLAFSMILLFVSLLSHSLYQNGLSGFCVIPFSTVAVTSSTYFHGYLSPSILYNVFSENPRYVSYFWFMLPLDIDFLIDHVGYSVVLRFSSCVWRFELS